MTPTSLRECANAGSLLTGSYTLLTHVQESVTRTLYKHFTSVSPGQSGRYPPSLRAPMLGGQPLTDMVSSKQTRTARLWIRRVLVRSQEGQLEARYHDQWC